VGNHLAIIAGPSRVLEAIRLEANEYLKPHGLSVDWGYSAGRGIFSLDTVAGDKDTELARTALRGAMPMSDLADDQGSGPASIHIGGCTYPPPLSCPFCGNRTPRVEMPFPGVSPMTINNVTVGCCGVGMFYGRWQRRAPPGTKTEH
jgi:hypothetical protein